MLSPFAATLMQVFVLIIGIIWFIVIAHVVVSWLVHFQVLNLRQPLVGQIWYMLNRLVEPIYRPIRRILPDLGGIDISPIILLLILFFVRQFILTTIAPALI